MAACFAPPTGAACLARSRSLHRKLFLSLESCGAHAGKQGGRQAVAVSAGISPSSVDLSLQEIILLSKSVSRHANECVCVVLYAMLRRPNCTRQINGLF